MRKGKRKSKGSRIKIRRIRLINDFYLISKQTRLTVRKGVEGKKPNALGVFLSILKNEGIAGLYSGVMAALVLVINPIIQYTVFEQLKNKIAKTKELSNFDFFLLGAFSKLCATGITYPYM